MIGLFHYTDRDGWNGIRAQSDWRFRASRPASPDRPTGVYFTDLEPSPDNLRTLCKRLRIPRVKREYVFWFTGTAGLMQLNDGRGRDRYIYFSPTDYEVAPHRQRFEGSTDTLSEELR